MSASVVPQSSRPGLLDKKFKSLGLEYDFDFVLHLPLRYEDETAIHKISQIYPGMSVQLEGVVTHSEVVFKPRKQLLATFKDDTGQISLRWIHFYPSQQKMLEKGGLVRIRGEVRGSSMWGFELIHPKMSKAGEALPKTLTPVYPTTEGLAQPSIRKAVLEALSRTVLADTLPEAIQQKYLLPNFAQSIQALHHPAVGTDPDELTQKLHPAWLRIKFDELLAQQLALAAARAARQQKKSFPMRLQAGELAAGLLKSLEFSLTTAQQKVIAEINHDLQQEYPMHRLLQGDVGSGKTIVAAMAAATILENGFQVAIMAPTEILAEQHFIKMKKWFEPLGIEVAWLSGSLRTKAKQEATNAIASGQAQLIIGTQALIQKNINFHRLGLMIVDEQHRFGVGQRLSLSRKGEHLLQNQYMVPHQLNMSATPIPRSLAMTFLADLEVSIIDELPPGRTPVVTKLFSDNRRDELLEHVRQEVKNGRQVYWVCPLVEESEALQLQTAVDTHARLQSELLDVRSGLLHGRLNTQDKANVMQAFVQHELDLLVATTVIEVGVDVPNASLMIIEHAERFGLAQLHQLRGRVGRGQVNSVCVLLYQQPLSKVASQRLKAMYETTDGFEIARRDLEQRGPGEFLGVRQSGLALLRFADIEADYQIVEQAREAAKDLRENYPEAVEKHLHRWMRGKEDYIRT